MIPAYSFTPLCAITPISTVVVPFTSWGDEANDKVINVSINDTLSRTVITSGTTLLVVGILTVFGGGVIHNFALALFFGVIVGTYSSIGVAAPLVFEWEQQRTKKRRARA